MTNERRTDITRAVQWLEEHGGRFDVDPGSPTWNSVKVWCERRIETARAERESPECDVRKLDRLLGEINALREILGIPDAQRRAASSERPNETHFGIPGL